MGEGSQRKPMERQTRRGFLRMLGAAGAGLAVGEVATRAVERFSESMKEEAAKKEPQIVASDAIIEEQKAVVEKREKIENIREYQIGDTNVYVSEYSNGPGPTYINLHQSESTSAETAREAVDKFGGRIIALRHLGTRNVMMKFEGRRYYFDPNRIFTDIGAKKTLKKRSARYSDAALQEVRSFAKKIIADYNLDKPAGNLVVAVHNNSQGGYSADSYAGGHSHDKHVEETFIHEDEDVDDFFYVTDRRLFEAFKKRGYNVVLQNTDEIVDDGSLSVYCGMQGTPYVNVEAQTKAHKRQSKMFAALNEVIEEEEV